MRCRTAGLGPEVRSHVTRLLIAELVAARDATRAAGAGPADLVEIFHERCRLVRGLESPGEST